jgi:hypothetical protein
MGAFLTNDSAAVRARDRMVLRVAAEQLHQRVGQHGLQGAQFGASTARTAARAFSTYACASKSGGTSNARCHPRISILRLSGCATVLSVSEYAVAR